MFPIYELMAQPALGDAIAIGLFAGLVALVSQAVGAVVQRRWSNLGADVAAVAGDPRLALGMLVMTGLGSALGWGYLWDLPLLTLAGAVLYILGGLLFCRATHWRFDEAVMAGLLTGFVTPMVTIACASLDIGLI